MTIAQKTVWVIEKGCYSDYSVVGVYTSKEAAELIVEKMKTGEFGSGHDATIAEWPLDPGVSEVNTGKAQWRVLMLANGDTEKVEKRAFDFYELNGSATIWERSKAPAYRGQGIPDILDATVWAKDKKHALKIVNEKRLAMIAAGRLK